MPKWLRTLLGWLIPDPPPPPPPPPPGTAPSMDVLRALINQERAARGLPALQLNVLLERAAQLHALDMDTHDNLSHTGSDGSDFLVRLQRVGYPLSSGGEIIAGGEGPPMAEPQVISMWMQSPGHRQHILGPYTEFGAGESGNFWCVDFGRRR